MSFSRVKPNGYQINERVLSGQINQLDIDHAKALDKTGDNVTGGGGISGEIDVKSGASIEFLSGSQLGLNSGASAASAGAITMLSGGTFTTNSGSTTTLNGAVNQGAAAFVTIHGTVNFQGSSANLTFGTGTGASFASGSSLFVTGTGILNSVGAQTVMSDSKSPVFATPQTRGIIQPLIVNPVQQSYAFNNFIGEFQDTASASYNIPLTKLINGATISSIVILVSPTGTPSTNASAYIQLYKRSSVTGSLTQLGTTTHAPGSFTALYTMSIGSIGDVIDDSVYSYYLYISSASDQPLIWQSLLVNHTGISSVGQI